MEKKIEEIEYITNLLKNKIDYLISLIEQVRNKVIKNDD
jgi:hypothetical protein